jgi:hypothetical protein
MGGISPGLQGSGGCHPKCFAALQEIPSGYEMGKSKSDQFVAKREARHGQ